MERTDDTPASNFIRDIIIRDLDTGKHDRIVTRFPPEPNGYLHIGHAKAVCLDFGLALEFQGECHLRFDDTNPSKEEEEYIRSIQEDIRWLGFDWGEHLYFASDYFESMHAMAVELVKQGKAYVDDLSLEKIREYRGTLTRPGKESPYRSRSVQENLDLFERMTRGEFADGSRVLRARIDMASPNLNLRDPVMYRILKIPHHRQGSQWNIYPMYDWAHGLEDSFEKITHSLCTLEFEDHRPLYDWFLAQLPVYKPRQIEFARLNMTYTVMSKRKLNRLVQEKYVDGWDDPRLPTLSGLRRRGYTPEAIRKFCTAVGVAKRESTVDAAMLDFILREDLNKRALRFMAVLRPLKTVITNYPADKTEWFEAENNPEDPSAGTRPIPFSRVVYIEQEDFMENPPKKFFRLAPGREIRLKHAYYITCRKVVKDESGNITELQCTYDPESRGGGTPDGRRVKGTSHWVCAGHAAEAEVRLYDKLFLRENPEDTGEGGDFTDNINPESLTTLTGCKVEPALSQAKPGAFLQFLRQGYFCVDSKAHAQGRLVFNRTVGLRDSWAKIRK